ncbi:hypothetical protein GCM10027440_33570 [Nocardiopsis coralliicola]
MVTGRPAAPPAEPPHDGATALAVICCAVLLSLLLTASASPSAAQRPADGRDDGMPLLDRAASAAESVAYDGVQSVGGAGAPVRTVEVVHRPGAGTVLSGEDGPDDPRTSADRRIRERPGLDERALSALADHYRVTEAGSGQVSGRTATVVAALRADGSTAGRFWIDDATGLPLRREATDARGAVVHYAEFTRFDAGGGGTGDGSGAGLLSTGGGQGGDDPWSEALSADDVAALRGEGWSVPGHLAWNLRLVDVRAKHQERGPVLHLGYTDGLTVVSVFAERGRLGESAGTAAGLHAVQTGGGVVYTGESGQPRRMWEADGYVYTLMSAAPEESVAQAAEALPAPDGAGFWNRVARGFERFGTWLGP